jgi:hypoxanthine phosphoribosyltransferase
MKKEYFSWKDFDLAVIDLAKRLEGKNFKNVYGIPRGGLILAVALSHRLSLPLTDSVSDATLVVDDISDSGKTLLPYRTNGIATIHRVIGTQVEPDYCYRVRKADWVVYPWEW